MSYNRKDPSPFDLYNAGARNIGDKVKVGCSYSTTVGSYVKCPSGFDQDGETSVGSCWFCTGDAGNNRDDCGILGVQGSQAICKLTQYTGEHSYCCLNDTTFDNDKRICSEDDRNKTSSCNDVLKEQCKNTNNFMSNICQKWISNNPRSTEVNNAIQEYCAKDSNITSTYCQNYCQNVDDAGKWCDLKMEDYCNNHDTDKDICGCYNLSFYEKIISALDKVGQTIIPWCNIKQCAGNSSAYKPSISKKSVDCPSQQICLQGIDLANIGGSADLKNITFNCANTNTDTNKEERNITTTIQTTTTTTTIIQPILVYIIIGIIIFIFSIMLYFVWSK